MRSKFRFGLVLGLLILTSRLPILAAPRIESILPADTLFVDPSAAPLLYYLVTGIGSQGEGPKGHFGQ